MTKKRTEINLSPGQLLCRLHRAPLGGAPAAVWPLWATVSHRRLQRCPPFLERMEALGGDTRALHRALHERPVCCWLHHYDPAELEDAYHDLSHHAQAAGMPPLFCVADCFICKGTNLTGATAPLPAGPHTPAPVPRHVCLTCWCHRMAAGPPQANAGRHIATPPPADPDKGLLG